MKRCKCPANSPFHWHERRADMADLVKSERTSKNSSRTVDRRRKEGKDPGEIPGLSAKAGAMTRRSPKNFATGA